MKAVQYQSYGGPEVLRLVDLPKPTPKPKQVLVKVVAASINAADYRIMRADPFLVRLVNGLTRPKKWPTLGSDFAGVIEAVGQEVTGLQVGDRVMGDAFTDGRGSWAEYVCVSEESTVKIPDSISFEDAASIPLAGLTALQALRDIGKLKAHEHVLIQGAGGGVGTLVVQIAKAFGAHVTATCGPNSVSRLRALGADRVIDYTKMETDPFKDQYDVVVAVNGYVPLRTYSAALKPHGRYAMVGGSARQLFEALLLAPVVVRGAGRSGKALTVNDSSRKKDLSQLAELLARGVLRASVVKTYRLSEIRDAVGFVEKGHIPGKVVVQIA